MKKFIVVFAVAAFTCMSSLAFAVDISTSGSIEYRMRSLVNTDLTDATHDNNNVTNERVRLNIDAKAGDALSGRIGIENDWDTWSRHDGVQGNGAETTVVTDPTGTTVNPTAKTTHGAQFALREAWINFKVPGTSVGIKGGHMLLQLGNGWFFRSMKFGSDAWVAYTDINALHLGVVNIKVAENDALLADDTDSYSLVATYKLSDTNSAGINLTSVNDRAGKGMTSFYSAGASSYFGASKFSNADIQNIGLHFTGKVGPVKVAAEFDQQMGKAIENNAAATEHKFKGNQIVVQANVPMDALTINATIAMGSGQTKADGAKDVKEYIALLDGDVHYTLMYEYLVNTAAKQSFKTKGTGFGNTTAISLGGSYNVSKNLMVAADVWMLQATEDITPSYTGAAPSNDLGTEIDVKVNWKMYENLTWNTTAGWFLPGAAYKISATADAVNAHAIQSVLSMKF